MKFRVSYHFYALITIALWSFAYVFTRLALRYFTAFSLGFLRYFIASCVLAILCLAVKLKLPPGKDLKWFLLAGALGFFAYMIFFNVGAKTVTAATSSIVIATSPVITALLSRLLYKERLSLLRWLAIGIEFGGVLLLTLMNGVLSLNTGVVLVLLASLVFSGYNLIQRRLTKSYGALQTSAYSIFSGTLMLAVFSPPAVKELLQAPPVQLFYIAALGVFSSAIAYLTWAKALSRAEKTSYVTNYSFITPVLTTVLGLVIAGETPDVPTLLGGLVILAGAILFQKAPAGAEGRPSQSPPVQDAHIRE